MARAIVRRTLPFSRPLRRTLPCSMVDTRQRSRFLQQMPKCTEDCVQEPCWFFSRTCHTSDGNGGMHVALTQFSESGNLRRLPRTLDLSVKCVRGTDRVGRCNRLLEASRRFLCSSLPISDTPLHSVFRPDLEKLPFNDDLGTSRQSKSKLGRSLRNNR